MDSRRLSTYPGWLVDEYADSRSSLSTAGPGAPSPWQTTPNYNPFLDELAQKSADMGDAELCYWSWQSLPGPQMRQPEPSVSLEDVNLWFENTNNEAPNFADLAAKRMKSHVTAGGHVMWSGCALGSTLRRAMCDNNKEVSTVSGARLQDCGLNAVYNQTIMIPMAIVIFKFRSSTMDQLKSFVHSWRTEQQGHVPQMTSSLVLEKGWGVGGQIISKTVPCSQIPEKFKYQNLGDCEQMGDSGMLLGSPEVPFTPFSWFKVPLCKVTNDRGNYPD